MENHAIDWLRPADPPSEWPFMAEVVLSWPAVERLMRIHGITSRDKLAKAVGIHRSHMYKISKRRIAPSLGNIAKLCELFHCVPGDLLRIEYRTSPPVPLEEENEVRFA